jgi:pyrimidine 5'-nucleotidase
MVDRLGVPEADVPSLCQHFYTTYGTTLAGLVAASDLVEAPGPAFYDEWHAAVHHTLPYAALLGPPDPGLRALLASLPQKKYIFTNADAKHAEICLQLLGLDGGLFDGVISFESVQAAAEARGLVRHGVPVVCKPADVAVALALDAAGVAASDAGGVVFFDDSARNVSMGAAAGVPSVLVGRTGVADVPAVAQVASIADLPTALPSLWRAHGVPVPPPRSPSAAALDAAAATASAAVESVAAVRNAVPAPRRRASMEGRRRASLDAGASPPASPVKAVA